MSTERFKNRYRIPSTRASWHNYRNGIYFVTICTKNREHFFGEIVLSNGKSQTMLLTDIGKCADDCWRAIPFHFPHVQTLSWVVMPDHIHGVLVINPIGVPQNPIVALVETQNFASLPPSPSSPPSPPQDMAPNHIANNQFGPQSKNLASVIRGFKIGVSKFARQHNLPFGWQPRYHEHIVRNSEALNRITKYIENNVSNWIPIIGDNRMSDIPEF